MRNLPIGVMDSGVGGLTVVSELWRQLPSEQILFYGDSLRCPYGDREEIEIRRFTFKALDFLVSQGVKMLVIACNTATAVCLEEAKDRYSIPIIGVIGPGARAAIAATEKQKVGVIGTRATIGSESYPKTLHRTHQKIEVISQACPGFVELVERGPIDREVALPIVASALRTFKDTEIDTMILGCTHYPLLAKVIGEVLGSGVRLINSAEETARDVSHWLTEHEMTRSDKDVLIHRFYTSGDANRFTEIATMWLGQKIEVSSYDVWDQEERKQKESSCARR